jgi:hypothetical protein
MVVAISMIVVVMMMAPIPWAVVSVVIRAAVAIITGAVVVRTVWIIVAWHPNPHGNVNASLCGLRSESNQSQGGQRE